MTDEAGTSPTTMTAKPLTDRQSTTDYETPNYENATITAEIVLHNPKPDSFRLDQYTHEPLIDGMDEREVTTFGGCENIRLTLTLDADDHPKTRKHVSITRGFRDDKTRDDNDVEWWSSALEIPRTGVRLNREHSYHQTRLKDTTNLWEFSTDEYLTWDYLVESVLPELGNPILFDRPRKKIV